MTELTPEERQKIYEEEKARLESEAGKPTNASGTVLNKTDKALCIVLAIIIGFGTITAGYCMWMNPTWEAERIDRERKAALAKSQAETKALIMELQELVEKQGQVEITSDNWYQDGDYFYYEGEIKNTGKTILDTVEAVASFYSDSGQFIKSDSSLIEYSPLMPGQSSPFKVMSRYHPMVSKASVGFKDFKSHTQIPAIRAKSPNDSELSADE